MKLIQLKITLSILIIGFTNNTLCQVYNFPIKPGSNEWKKLQTHDEMLKVCQIPDTVLSKISTKDLLETCLKYPLLMDYVFYNDTKFGFQTMCDGFNGFIELMKRNDAGKYLVEKYRGMITECILNDTIPSYQGHDSFRSSAIELILANDQILGNLNVSDKTLLIKDAMKGYEMKMRHKDIYGGFGQMTNVFLTTKILNTMDNKDWDLFKKNNIKAMLFSEKMMISGTETLDSIVLELNKIIK